jgi:hypothetical protein
VVDRRTLLRGLGTVAVGLPFMEEMLPRTSRAQDGEMPTRLVTLFFGLGIPREQTLEKFDGPLEPYASLENKIAFFTNLELRHAHDYGSGEPHFKVGDVTFVGDPQKREYEASGPSLEQIAKHELHPDGVPTPVGSKSVGMWFRTGSVSQYTRHWNQDGSPGERPERRPTTIFEQLFGQLNDSATTPTAEDPEQVSELHLRRSVLDSVKGEYEYYLGDRSPLGVESRNKLSVHLDNIRGVEQRLAPVEDAMGDALAQEACVLPDSVVDPADDSIPYDLAQGGAGGSAPTMDHEDFAAAFQLQGQLMALALRCDSVRFASMLFVGAGGHVGFRGTYNALGGSLNFSQDLPGTSSHDAYFHNNQWTKVRLHQHFAQVNIASVLQSFDDPMYLEANGKTVLDNTLVVVGTGYGGGGTTIGHEPSGVFHAIAGGNGHFRPGWYDTEYNIIDLYETVVQPYGFQTGMGSGRHPQYRYTPQIISELLA